jgi:hypothetical protein
MVIFTELLFLVPELVPCTWLVDVPVPEPLTVPLVDTVPVPVPTTLSPALLTHPLQPTKKAVVEMRKAETKFFIV